MQHRPDLRLCLPTGSTPEPAYRELAADHGAVLASVTLFLLDEFGLPAGHPARCDEMIRRTLLEALAAPPASVEALRVDVPDLAAECDRYEGAIAAGGLDLALLGLGGNGHLGLNEPGSTRTSRTRKVTLDPATVEHATVYGAGIPPTWGLTMGIGTILESREIWLLVTGRHKANILHEALTGPVGPAVPASFLREHPAVSVIADEAAAVRLV